MRKYLLMGMLITIVYSSIAQTNTFPTSGNVGIGTLIPPAWASSYKMLDLYGYGFIYGSSNGTGFNGVGYGQTGWGNNTFYDGVSRAIGTGAASSLLQGTGYLMFQNAPSVSAGEMQVFTERFRIDNDGNVGIGTTNPVSRLEVAVAGSTFTNNIKFGDASPAYLASGTSGIYISNNSGNQVFMVQHTGNVGIGTITPTEKLSVKGKIRAQEIKVENTNWPDYVFTKDYTLPTLQQTENHIKEKGHLPGIPSAAEVKTNGIDLGEMNAKLLQKIEELTLHLIEQDKFNNDQSKLIGKLQEMSKYQQIEINNLKNKK